MPVPLPARPALRTQWRRSLALRLALAFAALAAPLAPVAPPGGVPVPRALAQSTPGTPSVGVGPFARGAVVTLRGGGHTWVADEQGTLHWVPGERTMAARGADTSRRTEVTPEQLVALPRAEPWLDAPLVKIGDAIYVPRLEGTSLRPSLLRVASLADLALIGGTAGSPVPLEPATWEQQTGQAVSSLTRSDLPPIAVTGAVVLGWGPRPSPAGGFSVWTPTFVVPPPSPQPAAPPLPPLPAEPDEEDEGEDDGPFGRGGAGFPGLSWFPLLGQGEGAAPPPDVHVITFGGFYDGTGALFLALSVTLPEDARRQVELLGPDAAYELARAELVRSRRVELLAYRTVTQGVHRGREVSFEPRLPEGDPFLQLPEFRPLAEAARGAPSMTATARMYVIGAKLYVAAVLTSPAAVPTGETAATTDVARFLDSFRLLPA
jgi:hypothetical protein